MRAAGAWAWLRAATWLALYSLLAALPACTGAPPRADHPQTVNSPPPVQKAQPQRVARHSRPLARIVRPVPPIIVTGTDDDEKERLFRGFVEWQGAQDAAR